MTDRAHVQVTRIKPNQQSSINPLKTSNSFNRFSLPLPHVVKLPDRDYHRTLQSQHANPPRRFDSILRKDIRLSNESMDFNETMQSISVILLDSNHTNRLKPVHNPQRISFVHATKNSLNIPSLRQSHASNNHSTSNSQNIGSIEQRSDRREWMGLSRQQQRKKKQGFCESYCICSSVCKLLSLIGLIFLSAIIAGIITLSLISKDMTTPTTTMTTTTTASPCQPSCTIVQSCVKGLCVNVGYLACTLTWSRPGDGDIVVTTANNHTISYKNRGPSINTDGGQLDIDDQIGTGPENVYWASSTSPPPSGVYYICFEPYTILPLISPSEPLTVVYQIIRPLNNILTFTRTFTSLLRNAYNCDSNSTTLIGSFTYP